MSDLNSIPTEIFVEIIGYLDGATLCKCRRVNKKWKDIIDGNDLLWYRVCKREYRCSSKLPRQKASSVFKWFHIYKNLKKWSKITDYDRKERSFYEFSLNDINHALEINDSFEGCPRYRVSSQMKATKPIFENLAKLLVGKFTVNLDVTERRSGPVIIVGTFFELMLIEVNFIPYEAPVKATFGQDKIAMFMGLLKIRMNYFDNIPQIPAAAV